MLFYKRVELEEENGKDFSFDVSPDLLEVWQLGSPSFGNRIFLVFIITIILFKSDTCMYVPVLQWIWHDNMQFLQDKNIFEHTYFG